MASRPLYESSHDRKECPTCNGEGVEPCEHCNGRGFLTEGNGCPECGGQGWSGHFPEDCETCKGLGWVAMTEAEHEALGQLRIEGT